MIHRQNLWWIGQFCAGEYAQCTLQIHWQKYFSWYIGIGKIGDILRSFIQLALLARGSQ
jgi:hypothetical protein